MMGNNTGGLGAAVAGSKLASLGSKFGRIGFFGNLNEQLHQTGARSEMNFNPNQAKVPSKKKETAQLNESKMGAKQ